MLSDTKALAWVEPVTGRVVPERTATARSAKLNAWVVGYAPLQAEPGPLVMRGWDLRPWREGPDARSGLEDLADHDTCEVTWATGDGASVVPTDLPVRRRDVVDVLDHPDTPLLLNDKGWRHRHPGGPFEACRQVSLAIEKVG